LKFRNVPNGFEISNLIYQFFYQINDTYVRIVLNITKHYIINMQLFDPIVTLLTLLLNSQINLAKIDL